MEPAIQKKIQEMLWNISKKNYAEADKALKGIVNTKINDIYKREYAALAEKHTSSFIKENN